jgi:DNA helicase II / ATP-dependent DNA helicase PcrA
MSLKVILLFIVLFNKLKHCSRAGFTGKTCMTVLYIEGPMGSGKTTRLVQHVNQLLHAHATIGDTVKNEENKGDNKNKGADGMLVLCSNHYRQQQFIQQLLTVQSQALPQLPVYTFAGFVRNTLFNYWPLVETILQKTLKHGQAVIRPELSGLEDSELILKIALAQLREQASQNNQTIFDNFPGSDAHILKQVIRRLRLKSENSLSRQEMFDRSQLMDEQCLPEVTALEKLFDKMSYTLRVLDANKQLDILAQLLQHDNALTQQLTADIHTLVVDDVDETIAAQQQFIQFLAPGLQNLILAVDLHGGSRRGYLNAYPYNWQGLKALKEGETLVLERDDAMFRNAQTLLHNWTLSDLDLQDCKPLVEGVTVFDGFMSRIDMLEKVVADCIALLGNGYEPGDLAIVLPKTDFLAVYQLERKLSQLGIPLQLLSGTRRPSDNPKCKAFLSLMQWVNIRQWQKRPSRWEIKTLFTQVLKLNTLPGVSSEILEYMVTCVDDWLAQAMLSVDDEEAVLFLPNLENDERFAACDAALKHRYQKLHDWLVEASQFSFEQQLHTCFEQLIAPFSTEQDAYVDLSRMIESYLRQCAIAENLSTLLAKSFEEMGYAGGFGRWWLEQVKNGVTADTPDVPEALREEAVLLGTPQKMIDTEAVRRVYLWLDTSQREWAKSDNAPLYNAWVHSAVWDGNHYAFTDAFQDAVIRTRAGHITRTLMLLAKEKVYAYSSELDDVGFSQNGMLHPRLLTNENTLNPEPLERATLRADQKPILAYQQGTMAISAVPGAGKTFVNVELLLDLIERGIPPERIVVLTYMDSAAKTLMSRLKKKLASITRQLPYISTIHSLAFRILSDADNALFMGISPDELVVIDDVEQEAILQQIATATLPENVRSLRDWQGAVGRAIAHAKTTGVTLGSIKTALAKTPDDYRLAEFLPAYELYQQALQERGVLDFTDLILKAVGLLEDFPDCRARYQAQYRYIIEDEAQDSSRLLQRFIQLLGGEHPNLIRTGDTNQSITTTFSSGDTAVFREFMTTAEHCVQMTQSGRCAPEVIALSNTWLQEALKQPGLEQAFSSVAMQAIAGVNPALLYPVESQLFDMDSTERVWMIQKIQQVREENPKASIAILLRSNKQVREMTGQLQQARIPAISLSDQVSISPVFSLIHDSLQLVAEPACTQLQVSWYKHLCIVQDIQPVPGIEAFLAETVLAYSHPVQLPNEQLRQWAYDFQDFRRQGSGHNINTLIARMTDQFCKTVSSKSNGYLCALMASDILQTVLPGLELSPLEVVISQFDHFKRHWKKSRNFADTVLNGENGGEVVQVMSLHKAKGQEFDVVFMPFMQATHFPDTLEQVTFNESDRLILALDSTNNLAGNGGQPMVAGTGAGSPEQGRNTKKELETLKKQAKIEEEARLVYVGLTRAKRGLFLSAHQQYLTRYNKLKKTSPTLAFTVLYKGVY